MANPVSPKNVTPGSRSVGGGSSVANPMTRMPGMGDALPANPNNDPGMGGEVSYGMGARNPPAKASIEGEFTWAPMPSE